MMRTFAAALAAAAIAIGTGSGAVAQNVQNPQPTEKAPLLLTSSDTGADFTGIIVTQPTFVLVLGEANAQVCPDAVARVQAAAKGLTTMSVIIAKPTATSKTKDMSWALVFTPGYDDRLSQARTFGKPEFNVCEYSDKQLVEFLSKREFFSNSLMSMKRTTNRIIDEQEFVLARLAQLNALPDAAKSAQDKLDIYKLGERNEVLTATILLQLRRIDGILEQEGADARLQPEKLSPQ